MFEKYVFLIRAYNESSRILGVIEGIFQAWYSQIIVVDDGSTDGTANLVMKQFWEKIILIRHFLNRGGGAALETGFEYIRRNVQEKKWKWVVTFDADGQMNIADMQNFKNFLQKKPHAKVIFGSRFIEKTDSNVPFFRKIILFGGRIFTRIISWVSLTDAHNGYRMIAIEVLEKFHLTLDGMEYASELIDEIKKTGEKIYEIPVNIYYDKYTLAKWQRFGGVIRITLKMILKKIF